MFQQFATALGYAPGIALLTLLFGGAATADVVISSKTTANMDCGTGSYCEPTAANAVLNVTDLQNYLLQQGNVRVVTTGQNVEATNIVVKAAFTTPDSTSLSLQALGAIKVDAPVSIGSNVAELQLQSGTAGTLGDISFASNGNISFGSTQDLFNINGAVFQLFGSLPDLAAAANAQPSGFYVLANSYDASVDGTYKSSPINGLTGYFEALGNTISNLTIKDSNSGEVGLFGENTGELGFGVVRNLRLENVLVRADSASGALVGGIAGALGGGAAIYQSSVTGEVRAAVTSPVGGLVGDLGGTVASCWSSAKVIGTGGDTGGLVGGSNGSIVDSYSTGNVSAGSLSTAGGLVGVNVGSISGSFATGNVRTTNADYAGGLAGLNVIGTIADSYAVGNISDSGDGNGGALGGLIGSAQSSGSASTSYATGKVTGVGSDYVGGVVGYDMTDGGFGEVYWDTTTSGLSQGAGNIDNDPGLKGLTSHKLRAGLPRGFGKKVWTQQETINRGFPYLRDNPPPK